MQIPNCVNTSAQMTDTHQLFQNGTFGQQPVDQMHVTSIPYT
ncbi:hypothetical protein [Psychromonas marina]|nr:hypothetical protein [Psychromonas marina]